MVRKKESVEGLEERVNAPSPNWSALLDLLEELTTRSRGIEGLPFLACFARSALGAERVVVFVHDDERLVSAGSAGLEEVEDRRDVLDYARRLAGWVTRTGNPLLVEDSESDARFQNAPPSLKWVEALPLGFGGESLGSLVLLHEENSVPAECPEREALVGFLSRLGSIALSQHRAQESSRDLLNQIEQIERELLMVRRLAAAGEMAADMAGEIKRPLGGLGAIAAQVSDTLEEGDSRKRHLDLIVQEVTRLDRLLEEQIELATSPIPELGAEDINRLLNESLMFVSQELREKRIRLTKRLGPDMPVLLLDPDLMRRIILNMLRAGIEGATSGGRIKVQTKRKGDLVEVLVTADGSREPGQALDLLWKPFLVDDGQGQDVMASGIQRILREHRGVLRVSSTPQWPLVFSLVMPIPGNQDRRLSMDRRTPRDRRRA
jgi:signal transduction histidine kinase